MTASRSAKHRLTTLATTLALGALVGALAGAASALFLWLLERATRFRETHEFIVYALPLAGLVVGAIYEKYGAAIDGGANVVLTTIHDAGPQIPKRMTPMVLVGTVITHLFGGSAGREGTAVQMGASLADFVAHRLGAGQSLRRHLITAGVAGGFGSVFGTPVAGVIFALELPTRGRLAHRSIAPAIAASLVGDFVTRSLGIEHTAYPKCPSVDLTPLLAFEWVLFAAIVALVSVAFVTLTHGVKSLGTRYFPRRPLRMLVGGVVIVALWKLAGTSDYLGLGVPTIVRAFRDPTLPASAFAAKLVFTSVTLGVGFLGGEVTPLFFIGATLGNVFSRAVGAPLALGASVGLAAVFGAAAKTPLALTVMVVELVGAPVFPHALLVCALAYVLSGERGIYGGQR